MKIKLLSMKVKVIHGLVPNYLSLSFPCRGTYHLPSHFCTHTLNPTQSSQLLLESNGLWAQVPFSAPMRSNVLLLWIKRPWKWEGNRDGPESNKELTIWRQGGCDYLNCLCFFRIYKEFPQGYLGAPLPLQNKHSKKQKGKRGSSDREPPPWDDILFLPHAFFSHFLLLTHIYTYSAYIYTHIHTLYILHNFLRYHTLGVFVLVCFLIFFTFCLASFHLLRQDNPYQQPNISSHICSTLFKIIYILAWKERVYFSIYCFFLIQHYLMNILLTNNRFFLMAVKYSTAWL